MEYATQKQKAFLRSKGIDDSKVDNLTKKEASSMIDEVLAKPKGQGRLEGAKLSKLLDVADELMEHIQRAEVYQNLTDEQRMQAFAAILNAYASTTKKSI